MADDVTQGAPPEPEPEIALVPTRQERARRSSYRLRFGIIYVFLAAVVGAGIGSFIVLATGPEKQEDPAWSAWQPKGSTTREGAPDRRPDPEGVPRRERRAAHDQPRRPALGADAAGRGAGARRLRPPRHLEGARGGGRHRRLPRATAIVSFGLCGTRSKRAVRAEAGVSAERNTLLRPGGARALALHAQVRRRHRLGGRLHAADEAREARARSSCAGATSSDELDRPAQLAAPDGAAPRSAA